MFLCFMCALSSSLDTLAVSISYGSKKIKFPIVTILIVSIISTIGTYLSMKFGEIIISYTGYEIITYIGGFILIFLGIMFIYNSLPKDELNLKNIVENPTVIDSDNSGEIELNEAFLLAMALTINNLGVGIASAIAGLDILLTTIFTFGMTIISIQFGSHIGRNIVYKNLGTLSQVISGIIIMMIGVVKIIGL